MLLVETFSTFSRPGYFDLTVFLEVSAAPGYFDLTVFLEVSATQRCISIVAPQTRTLSQVFSSNFYGAYPEAYSKPRQICKMEKFVEKNYHWRALTILGKSSIWDVYCNRVLNVPLFSVLLFFKILDTDVSAICQKQKTNGQGKYFFVCFANCKTAERRLLFINFE